MYIARHNMRVFLSTPSSQRATPVYPTMNYDEMISIHALFAEGDRKYAQFNPAYLYQFVYKLTAFEPICVK